MVNCIYHHVKDHRYIFIFIIMLFLNITMSLIIAISLEKVYNLVSKIEINKRLENNSKGYDYTYLDFYNLLEDEE